MKRVLVLSLHDDNTELGAGVTVRKLIEAGAEVKYVVSSDCRRIVDTSRYSEGILQKECSTAATHLGINDLTIHGFHVGELPKYRQEILETIHRL